MGTFGRDLAFWLFALDLAGVAATKSKTLYWAAVLLALLFFAHFFLEIPLAVRKSRRMGLRVTVLVPLCPALVRLQLFLSGRRIVGNWRRAYEIHAEGAAGKELAGALARDLDLIRRTTKGLFIWETAAPVPWEVRRLIRELEGEGKAFWVKGARPLPKALLHGPPERVRAHLRHGAIVLE